MDGTDEAAPQGEDGAEHAILPPPPDEAQVLAAMELMAASGTAAVDFEASCLPGPGSYPIEVAACWPGGGWSALIRPTREWSEGGRWDPASEKVHGISRGDLERDGIAAADAFAGFAKALDGRRAFSSHECDQAWADQLAAAAQGRAPRILPYDELFFEWTYGAKSPEGKAMTMFQAIAYHDVLMGSARRGPTAHRAMPDAQELLRMLAMLRACGARLTDA